jgi:hypothetical protein
MDDQSHPNTPTDVSPQDFRLARGHDGWGGGNRRFRVVGNVIKVKNSDADPSILPSRQQRRKMFDDSGNYSQHVQQARGDPVFQLWMNKIGPYLADWVLDKRLSNDRAWLCVSFSCLSKVTDATRRVFFLQLRR